MLDEKQVTHDGARDNCNKGIFRTTRILESSETRQESKAPNLILYLTFTKGMLRSRGAAIHATRRNQVVLEACSVLFFFFSSEN